MNEYPSRFALEVLVLGALTAAVVTMSIAVVAALKMDFLRMTLGGLACLLAAQLSLVAARKAHHLHQVER